MRKHTLFAAVFLLLIILSFRNAPPIPVHTADAKIAPGESLFHGLPDKHPPEGMPLVPLLSGILTNHASAAQRSVLLSFAFVFFVLAVSALSAILQNRVQGLAAFALLSSIWIFNTGMGALDLEQLLYAGTVAAFAACFVWAARSPSGLNWGIAGISLALTLAVKSSLLMLAPLLAVFPLLPFLKRLPSPRPRNYAVFFAGPLIIAAGWSCVNYAVYNKPVMMETRRAHSNVITGALGLISTIEGNPYRLAGISPDANILAWAAKEVVRYPVRYLKAVSHRIYFILSGHWLLLLAGLCGFWIFRLDAGFRALAVLELYFLLAHCAMAVEERYFIAFWALLVPAAVAPFNGLIGLIRRNARPAEPARLTAMLAFLPFTALCLFAVSLTAIYPARVKTSRLDKQALAGAISENPKDPWLLARLGQLRLKAGETAAAIDLLGRAFQLSGRRSYGADYALALLAGGNRKALSEFLSGNDLGYEGTIISMFSEIKAASYLGGGKAV